MKIYGKLSVRAFMDVRKKIRTSSINYWRETENEISQTW